MKDLSEQQLREVLLTCDGRGKEHKAEALAELLRRASHCDLRSCQICGFTVDVSKGHHAPNPALADMRGGRGCKAHKT